MKIKASQNAILNKKAVIQVLKKVKEKKMIRLQFCCNFWLQT